jgi:hypothetical protein
MYEELIKYDDSEYSDFVRTFEGEVAIHLQLTSGARHNVGQTLEHAGLHFNMHIK